MVNLGLNFAALLGLINVLGGIVYFFQLLSKL